MKVIKVTVEITTTGNPNKVIERVRRELELVFGDTVRLSNVDIPD